MITRPFVLLSVAMSIDGYIDDATEQRLLLSSPEDFSRVDDVRGSCDAIFIGANTIRRDNPRLIVSDARRAERTARGLPEYPTKVTVTNSGLDPALKFFKTGGDKIVYCPASAQEEIIKVLGTSATTVGIKDTSDFGLILDDLGQRGIRRLMVEGGATIHTQFLSQNLADELHLAVAPFFVGQSEAPRFVGSAVYPQDKDHRMTLIQVRQVGDIAFACYRIDHERR
jgi:5-amino-6-(5-phosphoribosylamino)uracil reductase